MYWASSATASEGLKATAAWLVPLKAARQRGEQRKIPFDLHADAGALYLHRHLAAIGQPRPVHLRQRRCGEWFPVKFGVQRAERRTELGLDDSHRLRRREGCDVGVQATQRLGVLQRNIIRPQREHLPRLDKRRPEPLKRQPQPLGQRNVRLQMGRGHFVPGRNTQTRRRGDTHALRPSA